MNTPLLLAVDGGATKTTFVIMQDGQELFTTTLTGSNYQAIGQARVRQLFDAFFEQAAMAVTARHITVAVFGIAGIDTATDQQIVEQIIMSSIEASPFSVARCIIENDVEATLRGLSTEAATLLIAGTGAICFSLRDERTVRAGGWGHRISDEGSGYWIGQQIGRAIVRAHDGLEEATLLSELVLNGLDLQDFDAFINWIYAADYTNARLASLAKFLAPALEANDAVAMQITQAATKALAELIIAALQKTQYIGDSHTIYLNGGVLMHNPQIYLSLIETLHRIYPALHFERCQLQPIDYMKKRAQREL